MEMEPQDAARFEELVRLNMEMTRLADCIPTQAVSHRIKIARLRAVKRDAEARLAELNAMIVKYEGRKEPFVEVLDGMIENLQEKIAKKT